MPQSKRPTRLIIELEGSAAQPSGWVVGEHGARIPFAGWLQLLAALEQAMPAG